MPVYRLQNVIQPYAWGSFTAIAELLGNSGPTPDPQAELWMGTHPRGPSSVMVDGELFSLAALIEKNPDSILAPWVSRWFGGHLPFLFKVLAVDQPLSIQAHPDALLAREGFERENKEGKPLDAGDRNYRDDNHKPELVCALTRFWALTGFRPVEEAVHLLEPVCPDALLPELAEMQRKPPENGLQPFFKAMMTLGTDDRSAACDEIQAKLDTRVDLNIPAYQWMRRLATACPQDIGVLAPAFLNLVCLAPGQALYLPPGQLHAYLKGLALELMANSDNVLRGGLTTKHVDVPELLRVVRFEPSLVEVLTPVPDLPGEARFLCPATEFSLSVIRTGHTSAYHSPFQRSVDILLCTEGNGVLVAGGEAHSLKKGESVLLPADMGTYVIEGELVVYRATVPLQGKMFF
ncbi:mannose-6-phosphate isomerase, class I [Desulfosarcina sp. OttesenSCG-928-A07]|nr:mannose-6-phosphate isomerase, class I [Desulfosarcina sp. OttesenSCG-928-G17]MDL2330069.1 mannose-6-phosphate isomerase, class I [Desulfosarcina sp. OttesenSCG-928-A07]